MLAAALFELHVSRWQPLVSVGRLVSDGYGSERENRAGGAHIDTDFAGDTDDACAVATTLAWPEVEVVGITTTADPDGQRARYLGRFLELAGRLDVPVAAGAGRLLTTGGRCAVCLPMSATVTRRLGIDSQAAGERWERPGSDDGFADPPQRGLTGRWMRSTSPATELPLHRDVGRNTARYFDDGCGPPPFSAQSKRL